MKKNGDIPLNELDSGAFWSFESKPNATRVVSGDILNKVAAFVPNLIGGAANLAPSTKIYMKGKGRFFSSGSQ